MHLSITPNCDQPPNSTSSWPGNFLISPSFSDPLWDDGRVCLWWWWLWWWWWWCVYSFTQENYPATHYINFIFLYYCSCASIGTKTIDFFTVTRWKKCTQLFNTQTSAQQFISINPISAKFTIKKKWLDIIKQIL